MSLNVINAAHWSQWSYPAQRSDGAEPLGKAGVVREGQASASTPGSTSAGLPAPAHAGHRRGRPEVWASSSTTRVGAVALIPESGAGHRGRHRTRPLERHPRGTPGYAVLKKLPMASPSGAPVDTGSRDLRSGPGCPASGRVHVGAPPHPASVEQQRRDQRESRTVDQPEEPVALHLGRGIVAGDGAGIVHDQVGCLGDVTTREVFAVSTPRGLEVGLGRRGLGVDHLSAELLEPGRRRDAWIGLPPVRVSGVQLIGRLRDAWASCRLLLVSCAGALVEVSFTVVNQVSAVTCTA